MTNAAGEVLLDIPTGQLGPEGWIEDVMFHQPDVDALLRDAIEGLETVKLLTGHTAERVSQSAEGVAARVVHTEGTGKEFTGRYLVAADGASSTVRHHLGIEYEEVGPNDRSLVVDLRSALSASPQIVVLTETTPGVLQNPEFAGAAAVFARPNRYIYGTADSSEELEHLAQEIVTTIHNATASPVA